MTNKWEKRFFFSIGTECTHVPNLLLKNFRQLGLTETELVFILQLLMIGKNEYHSIQEISELLKIEETMVKQNLAILMEKGFIVTENVQELGRIVPRYFLDGLYDKLIDTWACEMAGKTDTAACGEVDHPVFDQKFGAVFSAIEKEFGRPLTPIENDKILEWLEPLGYRPEIILEALKRTVLRGVYNLNYIDRILLDWQKANIRTVPEIVNHEKFKMGKEKKTVRKSAFTKNSPKNLDDLYEL
ncbi:MAG: DnaD domain protein [Dehalobacterium sp.]